MNGSSNVQKPQGQPGLFSRFFSSHKHSSSMPNLPLKHRPISPHLLNDPAFSQDPTAHPLHSPSTPQFWSASNGVSVSTSAFDPLMLPPGHPLLKKDQLASLPARRPPLPPIAVSRHSPDTGDEDDVRDGLRLPLQPPNTPQVDGPVFPFQHMQPHQLRSDDRVRGPAVGFPLKSSGPSNLNLTTRNPVSQQNMVSEPTSASSSSNNSSPSTTPPSSANSHSPSKSATGVAMAASSPPPVEHASPGTEKDKTDEKRRRTFSFFRRKSAPPSTPTQPPPPTASESKLTKVKFKQPSPPPPQPSAAQLVQPPISEPDHRPPQPRANTAPELHTPADRPVPLPRSTTAPSELPQTRDAQKPGPSQPIRIRGLDRIDELDETNPFGSQLHHGGPYEAISRLVGGKRRHHDPAQNTRRDQLHKPGKRNPSHQSSGASSISIPQSTSLSLNIVPGQIIPRDLAYGIAMHPNMQTNPAAAQPSAQQPPQRNPYVNHSSSDSGHRYNDERRVGYDPSQNYNGYSRLGNNQQSTFPSNSQALENEGGSQQQRPQQRHASSLAQQLYMPQQHLQQRQTSPLAHRHPSLPQLQQRQASPPVQQSYPPNQQPGSETHADFDPYASYSPTSYPHELENASPPLSLKPGHQQHPMSKQVMTPSLMTVPLQVSPPPEQPPPTYQASAQQHTPILHHTDIKSPVPPPTQNLQLPSSGHSRGPSPAPSNYGSEGNAYGGIDGNNSDDGDTNEDHKSHREKDTGSIYEEPGSSGRPSYEDKGREDAYSDRHKGPINMDPSLSQIQLNEPSREDLASRTPESTNRGDQEAARAPEFRDNREGQAPSALLEQQLAASPLLQPPVTQHMRGIPSSSASSVKTGMSRQTRGPPPKTSHLPKKLVMPAPLQQLPQQGGYPGYGSQSNMMAPHRYNSPQRYPPPQAHYPPQHHHTPPPQHHPHPTNPQYDRSYAQDENDHVRFQSAHPQPSHGHPQSDPREHALRSPPPAPSQMHPPYAGQPVYTDHYNLQQQSSQQDRHTKGQYQQHDARQPSLLPGGSNSHGGHMGQVWQTRAQEVPMSPDRKVLRKKSTLANKGVGSGLAGIGSRESVVGVGLENQVEGGKESAKEKAKREKKEREREKKEMKVRERMKEKDKVKEKIPKRVLSKRRNDI